jgi:hypothetical protein
METINFKVGLIATQWRTMLSAELSEDMQYCRSTTIPQPHSDIVYVESI